MMRGSKPAAACTIFAGLCLAVATPAVSAVPAKQPTSFVIDLTLEPAQHSMAATTTVEFPAPAANASVDFVLNPALKVSQITDASGAVLPFTRDAQNPTLLHITAQAAQTPSLPARWTFHYTGAFAAVSGPAAQTAFIGEPASYLLPAANWVPRPAGREGASQLDLQVHAPDGLRVFSGGALDGNNRYRASGFGVAGLVVAGRYVQQSQPGAEPALFVPDGDAANSLPPALAMTAQKAYTQFGASFGALPWKTQTIIALPAAASAAAAPELAVFPVAASADTTQNALVAALASEWWQTVVHPATRDDAWITDGMTRMAELEYARRNSTAAEFADTVANVSASAIAYSKVPLLRLGEVPQNTPQFSAMAYDKGGMIFRMLRWRIGEPAFDRTVHAILAAPGGAVSALDVQRMAEAASGKNLQPFFAQWLGSAQIPELKNTWTLYRLQAGSYQLVGDISQNTDLFQMPVALELRSATGIVSRRISLEGARTSYSVDSSQPPTQIRIDPNRELLRTSPQMQVRAAIILGMNERAAGRLEEAAAHFHAALGLDPQSSLTSYRLAETLMQERNNQGAADAFRAALRGDGKPAWIEVWSDLKLGMLFDAMGERDRAVNQYREALQTGDDTGGALSLARKYLEAPYKAAGGQ